MPELGKKLIVSNTINKKISLLNYLETGPKTIASIAEYIGSSEKTIRNWLNEIETDLPQEVELEFIRSTVVTIHIHDYFIFSSVIKSWIEESPLFGVIENLFYGSHLSLGEYADSLFVSESTMRNYLKILAQVVREYNLTLTISPTVKLLGKEEDLRYFFFKFFVYAKNIDNIMKENDHNAAKIYEHLAFFAKEYNILLFVDYHRLVVWMFVLDVRLSQKRYVSLEPAVLDKHLSKDNFLRFSGAFNRFFSGNSHFQNLPIDELVYTYVTRLTAIVYEDGKVFFMEEYMAELEQYTPLVTDFFEMYNLNKIVYSELAMKLKAYLANLSFLSDTTELHQLLNVEEELPEAYKPVKVLWKKLLLQAQDKKWKFPEDIAASLAVLTCNTLIDNNYQYKNILFSLTGEPAMVPLYKTIIRRLLPHEANAHFLFNQPITKEIINVSKIDIIVCNTAINLGKEVLQNLSVVKLSPNPTNAEWEALGKKLYSY